MNSDELAKKLDGKTFAEALSLLKDPKSNANGLTVIFGTTGERFEPELTSYPYSTFSVHTGGLPCHGIVYRESDKLAAS